LDLKEKNFLKKLEKLESEVAALRQAKEAVTASYKDMKLKMVKRGAEEMMQNRDREIQRLQKELLEKEQEANEYQNRNLLVQEMLNLGIRGEVITIDDLRKHIEMYQELIEQDQL
jgi:predicted RNase H-like nuclease (RuvC/YqgF family)